MTTRQKTIMTRGSTLFLRLAALGIGMFVLALCALALPSMWMHVPQEYPDASNNYAVYGVFITMYITAIPFFFGLYQAVRILDFIDNNKAFSKLSVQALKRITYSATAIGVIYALSLPLFYLWADGDDAPGLVIIGMILTLAPLAVAVFAAVLRRLLQDAIDIKKENDLTV